MMRDSSILLSLIRLYGFCSVNFSFRTSCWKKPKSLCVAPLIAGE